MKIVNAQEILSLFRLATFTPQSYGRLMICAPFISFELLFSHILRSGKALLPTVVITRPETAKHLLTNCSNYKGVTLGVIQNLHAKIYIACGKVDKDSVALVGSFNMTGGALYENFELGIRIKANTQEHICLIRTMESRLLAMSQIILHGE